MIADRAIDDLELDEIDLDVDIDVDVDLLDEVENERLNEMEDSQDSNLDSSNLSSPSPSSSPSLSSIDLPYDCKRISELSGISYSHIRNVLLGKSKVKINTAHKISSAMNLTLDEFYDMIKTLTPGSYSGGRELDESTINLIKSSKGKMTTRSASAKYGVSRETISRIWKSE